MKNIFVFTMRDTDTQSAREKVLDAMRKAGKEAGVSNFRYIMTQSTCLVNDDIIICDGHQYATEMGFYNKWKNRSRLGQCAGADWDTFDAAKLMIFSETVAF